MFAGKKKRVLQPAYNGLTVYSTKWQAIGWLEDFPFNQPQVLLVGELEGKRCQQRLIYVLRYRQGIMLLDLERGGQYEWRVQRGQVMIRKRLPR